MIEATETAAIGNQEKGSSVEVGDSDGGAEVGDSDGRSVPADTVKLTIWDKFDIG